jgi:shikimate dehydrogenase
VVNTTSLSHGSEPFPLLPWGRCRKGCLAYDISYGRAPTAFCQQATNAGLEALDGLPMLIVQAQHAYAFWFGSMPVMEAPLMDALRV